MLIIRASEQQTRKGLYQNQQLYEPPDEFSPQWLGNGNPTNLSKCVLDGIPVDCSFICAESSVQCPHNDCGPRWNRNNNGGRGGFDFFYAFGDGFSGYMAQGARYEGNGVFRYPGAGDRPVGHLNRTSAHGQSRDNPPRYELAPLELSKLLAVMNAMSEISQRLRNGHVSKDCKEKVLDKLATIPGFSAQKFAEFLNRGGKFYDGTMSQAKVRNYDPAYSVYPDMTLAGYFSSGGKYAMTSTNPARGFVVFYDAARIDRGGDIIGINPGNLAFQFHEGLHGFGNVNNLMGTNENPGPLSDRGLQTLFGIATTSDTRNISEYIKKYCFQ